MKHRDLLFSQDTAVIYILVTNARVNSEPLLRTITLKHTQGVLKKFVVKYEENITSFVHIFPWSKKL